MDWDDDLRAYRGQDGAPRRFPLVTNGEQARRWQRAGYDPAAAIQRFAAFRQEWLAEQDGATAFILVSDFLSQEKAHAIEQGLVTDDPDLWRFDAAARHFLKS